MCIQLRQPGNCEISSEHPEQMKGVTANKVALQRMGSASIDFRSPMAIFFFNDDSPIPSVMAKVLTFNFEVNAKLQLCKSYNIDLVFSLLETRIYFPVTSWWSEYLSLHLFPTPCIVFHLPFQKLSVVCTVQSTYVHWLGSQRGRWEQPALLFSITQVWHFQGFLTKSFMPEVIGDPHTPG